jgi:hypothetical protein
MAKSRNTLTQARLKELLHYDPETGVFTWLVNRGRKAKAGDRAGRITDKGYNSIRVEGLCHFAHRLAWIYVHGEHPSGIMDHINGVRHDNRISNLRVSDYTENAQNRRKARSSNLSGFLGVATAGNKFQSWINIPGKKRIHLGTFITAEEAHEAYVLAKRQYHPGNTL